MKKVTIICGGIAKDTTAQAKALVGDRKAVWLFDLNMDNHFQLSAVSEHTEVIVVEALPAKRLSDLKFLMEVNKVTVNQKGKWPKVIIRPELIVTTADFTTADFEPRRWLEVIECRRENLIIN